jgi:hypothetical protein
MVEPRLVVSFFFIEYFGVGELRDWSALQEVFGERAR